MENPYPTFIKKISDSLIEQYLKWAKSVREENKLKTKNENWFEDYDLSDDAVLHIYLCTGVILPIYVLYEAGYFQSININILSDSINPLIKYALREDANEERGREVYYLLRQFIIDEPVGKKYSDAMEESTRLYLDEFAKIKSPISHSDRRYNLYRIYSEFLDEYRPIFTRIINEFFKNNNLYLKEPDFKEIQIDRIGRLLKAHYQDLSNIMEYHLSDETGNYMTGLIELEQNHRMLPREIVIAISLIPWFSIGIEYKFWKINENLNENKNWVESVYPFTENIYWESDRVKAVEIITNAFSVLKTDETDIKKISIYKQFRAWCEEHCKENSKQLVDLWLGITSGRLRMHHEVLKKTLFIKKEYY